MNVLYYDARMQHSFFRPRTFTSAVTVLSLLLTGVAPVASAQESPFSDLPATHSAYAAVMYLREKGVLQGYPDGTFKPDKVVTRAEAVKMITAPKGIDLTSFTTSPFTDVPAGSWFLPYVEIARTKLGIVQGPPTATAFRPADPVKRSEFLKLFLAGNGLDYQGAWKDITSPLATDTASADWYYPYMRFAVGSSLIQVDTVGSLMAGTQLTRGQVALIMYRWAMFEQGRRTQALLSEAESEILNVLSMIEAKELDRAGEASNRSILAARGALVSKPDSGVVKGAVKVSEGFGSITSAYKAGMEQRFDDAITLAGQAWQSGEKAKEFAPELAEVVTQMQTVAKTVADSARAAKAGGGQ